MPTEVLGAESCYGLHVQPGVLASREAVLRLTVTHSSKEALALFAREIAPAGTSWSPGTTGAGGRPSPSAMIRQYAFLLEKGALQPAVVLDGVRAWVKSPVKKVPARSEPVEGLMQAQPERELTRHKPASAPASGEDTITVPLIEMAYGRSGDKGDTSNIGLIARQPAYLPCLRAAVTEEAVAAWLAHLVKGRVTRYELPGIDGMNFVCERALGGDGMSSLRNDPLGKGMAQILLAMPVRIPAGVKTGG